MLTIELQGPDGKRSQLRVADDCTVGKGMHSEIRLNGWRIAKEHARLFRTPAGVVVEDLGAFSGISVNGRRIETQYGPLTMNDVVAIGAFQLKVVEQIDLETRAEGTAGQSRSSTASYRQQRAVEEIRNSRLAAERAQNEVLHTERAPTFALTVTPDAGRQELEFTWRKRIHASLLETMDLRRHDTHGMSDERLRIETQRLIQQIVDSADADLPSELDRARLCSQVLDEAIGLGPLEELLADDSVTEIMVNRFDEIYVERSGCLLKHSMAFTGDRAVLGVIERIVAPLGRRIDESSPMVDARLKDGSRVNAIIPPLALKGPCLTIRKFAKRKLEVGDLVKFDAISSEMASFLEQCVTARKNIIVSGGTGSGKTTLLNILSNFIPSGERIVTIEDAAELKLHHAHLISLESRPANVEGKGGVAIRDLVRNTLRMRPDRIVVGECRGAEALDMLQAMNTGHEGSLTTLHANTARDALARLETMVLMAGMELPLTAIREQIASAVHIIVQQTRFACGARKVIGISEITGIESGRIQLQELFRFAHQGYTPDTGKVIGHFTGCDMVPRFYEQLQGFGTDLDMKIFKPVGASKDQMFGDQYDDLDGGRAHE
jgi:pilus assembly protein CpaF